MLDLFAGHFARMIERRIAELSPRPQACELSGAVVSRVFAGGFVELLRWWILQSSRPTPKEMDDRFHEIVWNGLARGALARSAGRLRARRESPYPPAPHERRRTPLITGAHTILYSKRPEADREFLRDVLRLPNVDVGEGWLIFGLPPAEVAVHASSKNDLHEFYLMCDDVEAFIAAMKKHKIACTAARDLGWGILTQLTLPGGGKLGVYQPRHARPKSVIVKRTAKPRKAKVAKKTSKKSRS